MANTTISETMLAGNLQRNEALRMRIESIFRDKLWDTPGVNPTVHIPLDDLSWAVASTDSIRTMIRNAMDDGENSNINKNIGAITDQALYTAVISAMSRLNIIP